MSFYLRWFDCIVDASRAPGSSQETVEETCDKVAKSLVPDCIDKNELIIDDEDIFYDDDILDLRGAEDDFLIPICE